jgi:predicted transcriptional regulator
MKTAISIPDDVFEEAERLAARTDKSRSQLYTEAMREYLARHDPDAVTERLDEVVDELAPAEDRFVAETTRSVLLRVEW